jgi:hypothetical protein
LVIRRRRSSLSTPGASVGRLNQVENCGSGDLDILINNAGIMAVPQSKTLDGFDKFGYRLAAQKKVEYCALPTLYAATQDVPGNTYIGPGGRSGELPKIEKRSKSNNDSQMARQLWDLSSRLTHAG